MKIVLNGKEEIIKDGSTVAGLVTVKGLNPNTIIVEYNNELIKKEKWGNTSLKDNDRLEILKFVGGG